jgi:predicted CopG family antitoxin
MLLCMSKYVTISVPVEVKERLGKAKGNKEWGEFLLELYTERRLLKSKKAFEELANLVAEEDIQAMVESSEEFREKFTFA